MNEEKELQPGRLWYTHESRDEASQRPIGPGARCWCGCGEVVPPTARHDAHYRSAKHRMRAAARRRPAVVSRARRARRRAPRFEGGRPRLDAESWARAKSLAELREVSVSKLVASLVDEALQTREESKAMRCQACNGEGQVPIGEHYVTREMAVDAGDPSLEGELYEVEYAECEHCHGVGILQWLVERLVAGGVVEKRCRRHGLAFQQGCPGCHELAALSKRAREAQCAVLIPVGRPCRLAAGHDGDHEP